MKYIYIVYFFQASRRPSEGGRLPLNGSLVMQIFWRRYVSRASWLRMRQMLMEIFQQYLYTVSCCHHLSRTSHARCVGSSIRAVDRTLGMVCGLETFCTSCNKVINVTLSSDHIEGTQATNVPFVVVRSAVSATMDMSVGYSGFVKFI